MDVNMPVMGGLEASKAIKDVDKKNNISNLVIMGCTAYSDVKTKTDCFKNGMDYFLKKPVSKELLF